MSQFNREIWVLCASCALIGFLTWLIPYILHGREAWDIGFYYLAGLACAGAAAGTFGCGWKSALPLVLGFWLGQIAFIAPKSLLDGAADLIIFGAMTSFMGSLLTLPVFAVIYPVKKKMFPQK